MIRGIHYFSTELKTKIDVIPRGCFNLLLTAKRISFSCSASVADPTQLLHRRQFHHSSFAGLHSRNKQAHQDDVVNISPALCQHFSNGWDIFSRTVSVGLPLHQPLLCAEYSALQTNFQPLLQSNQSSHHPHSRLLNARWWRRSDVLRQNPLGCCDQEGVF